MQTLKQRRVLADYQTAKARMAPRPPLLWMLWMRIKNFRLEWD